MIEYLHGDIIFEISKHLSEIDISNLIEVLPEHKDRLTPRLAAGLLDRLLRERFGEDHRAIDSPLYIDNWCQNMNEWYEIVLDIFDPPPFRTSLTASPAMSDRRLCWASRQSRVVDALLPTFF